MAFMRTLLLLLPLAMFGLASSFLTLLVVDRADDLIWTYAIAMFVLTTLHLWAERFTRARA